MPLHLWEAIHDADVRREPIFDIDPTMVGSMPPSLQRVLLAAATLWCRTITWPTVREISTTAGVAASTSISVVGSSAALRTLLIESERRTIDNLWIAQPDSIDPDESIDGALYLRVRRLAAIEPALAALPILVSMALGEFPLAIAAMRPFQDRVVAGLRAEREVA